MIPQWLLRWTQGSIHRLLQTVIPGVQANEGPNPSAHVAHRAQQWSRANEGPNPSADVARGSQQWGQSNEGPNPSAEVGKGTRQKVRANEGPIADDEGAPV